MNANKLTYKDGNTPIVKQPTSIYLRILDSSDNEELFFMKIATGDLKTVKRALAVAKFSYYKWDSDYQDTFFQYLNKYRIVYRLIKYTTIKD